MSNMQTYINRIKVEFKILLRPPFFAGFLDINRITVEFKTRKAPVKLSAVVYINRITVEFKRESGELTIEGKMILIESQWNLKSGQFYCSVVNDGNINRITVEFKNWRTRNVFRE